MLRQALSELRLRPGRFVATLIAIAISVGFIAAISVFISTEQAGTARANSMGLSQADLAVHSPDGVVSAELADAVARADGVAAAQPVLSRSTDVTAAERTVFATLWADVAPDFRWADLDEGRYPETAGEIAVSRDMADTLGVTVGDEVGLGGGSPAVVVGITRDAESLFASTGYIRPPAGTAADAEAIAVRLAPDADPDAAAAAVGNAVADDDLVVETAEEYRASRLVSITGEFDIFRNMLLGFAGVAVLVGMITIGNTFAILVTQRRRQLGLLRAVGATGGQVMGRLLTESLLLGLAGSLIGIGLGVAVAAVGTAFTGSIFWGIVVNWAELGIAVVVGVTATVASAVLPAVSAARVAPLAALQTVPSAAEARRAGLVRIIVAVLFLAGGGLLAVTALGGTGDLNIVYAVGAGGLLTIGVLGAAPLFVPALLSGMGRLFGGAGPTTRLALKNSARNPRRSAATATALMLAIGLVVTLQVGLASARTSGMDTIDREFPLDLAATYAAGVPAGTAERVEDTPGVESVAVLRGKPVQVDGAVFLAVDDRAARAAMGVEAEPIPDGIARFEEWAMPDSLTVDGTALDVQEGRLYGQSTFGVSEATLAALPGETTDVAVWVKLADRTDAAAVNAAVAALTADGNPDLSNSGAQMAGILEQVIDVVVIVMTALLGVAVAIAIVGVSNTLGLSVIERQRESALLRALGMQRGQLRGMLLIEALALAVVGIVVGVGAGVFFAWLGLTSAFAGVPGGVVQVRMTIEPMWTVALVGVCLAAAALASVLPGRRAANATPTQALAVE